MTRYRAAGRVLDLEAAQGRPTVIFVTPVPPFDPDAGEPAYVYSRVADHLAARIIAGDLRLGARLPGERDLAAEYGVALGTARRAVSELRRRGLAVTLPSRGTFVVSSLPSE